MRFFRPFPMLIILASLLVSQGTAYAQEEELDFEERQACFQKVGTFLSSFLSTDGAADYWKDILRRNRCQQEDIFALDEEVEELLVELYETDCTVSEFMELQGEIQEKKMEVYYVRHIVDIDEDTAFEKDVNAVDWELVRDNLYDTMVKRYVKTKKTAWVEEEDLAVLFEEWKERYEDRVDSYLACNESPWQEVSDKTREFFETIKEINETFKKNTQQMKDEFEETQKQRREEAGIVDENGEFVGTGAMIKAFLKKTIQVQVSNLPSKETLEDIKENFEAMGSLPSTGEATQGTSLAEFQAEELSRRAELVGKYTFLYAQGNAEVTTRLRYKITELRDIVQISTDGVNLEGSSTGAGNLKQLKATTREIWKKQGKTSVKP